GVARQSCGGGAAAGGDVAGLLPVPAVLLVGLYRDAVFTQRHRLLVVVQAVPYEVVLPRRPRGTRDGSKLAEITVKADPERRQVRVVLRFSSPDREDSNQL